MNNYTWPHYHQENVWYTHTSNINFGSVLIFLSSWPKLTGTIFNEQLKVNQCKNTYRSLQKARNCKTGKDDCWFIITDHETYCSGDISPMLCHEKTFELRSRWKQDCYPSNYRFQLLEMPPQRLEIWSGEKKHPRNGPKWWNFHSALELGLGDQAGE